MKGVEEAIKKESTIVCIEDAEGKRWIHYMGFGYYAGEPNERPYRFVEYTHCTSELQRALHIGLKKFEEEHAPQCKQYVTDCDYEKLKHIYQTYYCGSAPTPIKIECVDINTPRGCYMLTD